MRELSRILRMETHWIDVYEDMTTRAYAMFFCGKTKVLLRDPVYSFETNYWESEDLRGDGPREFSSLKEFYAAISPYYTPMDQYWTYDRWDQCPTDVEVMPVEGEWKSTTRCFTLRLGQPNLQIEPAGEWSELDFAGECKELLNPYPTGG